MSLTVNVYYTGSGGSARAFADEMVASGTVDAIRAQPGNLRYAYFFPMDDPETLLLIDSWTDQESLDRHHASPMMHRIATLRERHDLHMRVERFISDDGGKTWSEPQNLGYHGAPPHLLLHSSGALICAYGRRDDGTRWNDLSERALISWDGGETWAEDLTIFGDGPDWDLGYPATVELSDGSLLTAYYQKYQDPENDRKPDNKASFLYTKWRLTKG